MQNLIRNNWERNKYFLLTATILVVLVLFAISYKNDEIIQSRTSKISYQEPELSLIKKFFLSKINSPFIVEDYEIKSGDSIQKILKNYKIKNKEIQNIIEQYKKYGNPNKLLMGNKISVIVEKQLPEKNNSTAKTTTSRSRRGRRWILAGKPDFKGRRDCFWRPFQVYTDDPPRHKQVGLGALAPSRLIRRMNLRSLHLGSCGSPEERGLAPRDRQVCR